MQANLAPRFSLLPSRDPGWVGQLVSGQFVSPRTWKITNKTMICLCLYCMISCCHPLCAVVIRCVRWSSFAFVFKHYISLSLKLKAIRFSSAHHSKG